MTYTHSFLFVLLLIFLSVPVTDVQARTYENPQMCQEGQQSGELPGDLVLDCRFCVQEGLWEYEPGDVQGTCVESGGGVITGDEAYQNAIANGYRKTAQACSVNGAGGSGCAFGDICFAENDSDTGFCYSNKGLVNLLKFNSVPELINGILELMVRIGSILLVFFLVLTGFKFVAAQGNPEAVSQARTALMWVLIGGLILVAAQALSLVIGAAITSL